MSGAGSAAPRARFRAYPEYRCTETWLGAIPDHWDVRPLRQIGTFSKGRGGTKEDEVAEGIPCVRYGDLYTTHRGFISETRRYLARERANDYTPLSYGDLLFAASGETLEEIGKSAVCLLHSEVRCGSDVIVFRPASDIDPVFLGYAADAAPAAAQKAFMGTGSIIKHIDAGRLKQLVMAVPPVEEQRSIAAFLDRETAKIDALAAKQERLIEVLREARIALITQAVMKSLGRNVVMVESGDELFPAIPAGWRLMKLGRLLSRVSRPVQIELAAQYREIGTRSWGKGIFHKDAVTGAQLEDKSVFYVMPGDLILNIVFAWEGAVAIASDREAGMVASHRFPTFRHTADLADPDYVLMFLQSEQGRALMGINSPGAAGRNRTIRLESFLREEIPVPPLDVQHEIVKSFRAQEQLLMAAEVKADTLIDRLRELRTALISAAVTGKVNVRERALV